MCEPETHSTCQHSYITTGRSIYFLHSSLEQAKLVLVRSESLCRPRAFSDRVIVKLSKLVQGLLHRGQLLGLY